MALREKLLGQLRPANTTAASLYSPGADVTAAIIKTILVCNQTGSAATFRLFHDDDGTTYDESTALYFDESVAANTTKEINLFMAINNSSGNIGVRTGTNNALTFSAYGAEILNV